MVVVIFISVFFYIFSVDIPFLLQLTFVANLSLYAFLTHRIFRQKRFNPLMCTSVIFFLCFFILAPLIQLQNSYVAPNRYVIQPDIAIYTNILIFVFYVVLYMVLKDKGLEFEGWQNRDFKKINRVLLGLSIVSLIVALPFLRHIYVSEAAGSSSEDASLMETLIIRKVMLSFPFFALLAFLSLNKLKASNMFIFFVLLLILLIAKNPLLEKRNALGPIYLTLLYVAFSKNLANNFKFYISNLILFVVFFPLSALLTHSDNGSVKAEDKLEGIEEIQSVELGNTIYDHFRELHYDAWSMINATVDYSDREGVTMGRQFLGAALFFFPRQLWNDKPIGSGSLVAQEFIYNVYGFDFFNLSSPLVAEGYINFGFFGVVLFAFILGRLFVWSYKNLQANRYDFLFIIYTSFYMFFLLRGDLQNGLAYFVGPMVPYMIIRVLLLKKGNKNKNNMPISMPVA